MNEMPDGGFGGEPPVTMLLLNINQTYWLYEGAEYLNQMLLGRGGYPVPVRCMVFRDAFELRRFLGPNRVVTDMWGINPDIVARLRRDSHLVEVSPDLG